MSLINGPAGTLGGTAWKINKVGKSPVDSQNVMISSSIISGAYPQP